MSSVQLHLEGEVGGISATALITALDSWLKILRDIDVALSGVPGGSLLWVVSELRTGSLVVTTEARSKLADKDFGAEVAHAAIQGLQVLEEEGLTPPYLTADGVGHAKRLLKVVGNGGVRGIQIANHKERVALSARASANVDQLLFVQRRALGSVEGRLEKISIHEKQPRFVIYHHHTHKAVTCAFAETLLDQVVGALGRRVIATGLVAFNAKNEPVYVQVERLRLLRTPAELPTIDQLSGSDPLFTGDESTSEYLRSVRGG